ncbi:unnamed protein product, partial [Clonostachys chloroleuca]
PQRYSESPIRSRRGQTGLYTLPHLIVETEMIRISGHPISHDLFAKYAWEVINALSMDPGQTPSGAKGPGFRQSMFLISLRALVAENVDVAVIEVHTGGRSCITPQNLVTTLRAETWYKAGIFKGAASDFSINQVPEATKVLEDEAKKQQLKLGVVGTLDNLRNVTGFNSAVQRQKSFSRSPIQKALDRVETIKQQPHNVHVLVTSSVFLVSDVLRLLDYKIN